MDDVTATSWPAALGPSDDDALPPTVVVPVDEMSQVGEARRTAAGLAARLGFDEMDAGRIALVATEAATNLARYAVGGVLLVQPVRTPDAPAAAHATGIELVAVDRGPGIRDLARAAADGFSTGGTAGQGLGAMRRAADEFDAYSGVARVPDPFDVNANRGRVGVAGEVGPGTIVLARFWAATTPRAGKSSAGRAGAVLAGGVSVPLAGEMVCGDAWAAGQTSAGYRVLLADGLGHGRAAAEAAQLAVRLFSADIVRTARAGEPTPLATLLEALHLALRATRGAAVSVAEVRTVEREVRFVGVGNVAASVITADGDTRSLVSHNGTVGHQLRKVQEFRVPWPTRALLVLHSDGLRTQWRLSGAPGLAHRHPTVVAAALWRDHARGRDDATAVVLRDGIVDNGGNVDRDAGPAAGEDAAYRSSS